MNETILVAAIAMMGGAVIGPTVQWLLSRRKTAAETDKTAVETEGTIAAQWQAWSAEQSRRIDNLERDVAELKQALADEEQTNRQLRMQVEHQSRLLRSVVRWAITLRDELLKVGGSVPPTPVDVESALTSLDTDPH